ncbi:CDF family Co(II)/Ni(II) efflux transporter DmeF [Colwellia sp. RE-S-Sl-9]
MSESNTQFCHSHDLGVNNSQNMHKVKIVFWLTTVVMFLEIGAGTWTGSMALLADGWHMGTHSAAFLITIFTYTYAKKHAQNKSFSFGTGKVNYLGGFASAVALAIVALMMVIESVQRLIEPHNIHFNEAIIVAIIGLSVNVLSVFILKDDHHHHHHGHDHDDHEHHEHGHDHHAHQHGHKHGHQDHNIKAAYFHVLADTLTSILAIVALLIGKYIGLTWMDPLMGIVGALVIFHWSFGLIKESSSVLLDKSVKVSTLEKIAEAVSEKNAIVKDLHVWKIATSHQAAILTVSSTEIIDTQDFKKLILKFLPHVSHVTVEIDNS